MWCACAERRLTDGSVWRGVCLQHLENYLQYAKKQGDEKGQNHACSVLAKCYERKDDIPQATAYLKRLIKTSERAGQHKITSEAASRLGKLFARTNEHEEAVHWQTQAFESASPPPQHLRECMLQKCPHPCMRP